MQINKDNIRENNRRLDHDYKFGDKFVINSHSASKYETPYKSPFVITHCWTNGTIALQCGAIKIKDNIHHIKPHTYDTNL